MNIPADQAKYYRKRKVWLDALKALPCIDCGGTFPPECMDFDHRDKSIKRFGIAQGIKRRKEIVLAEIAKCDLVCANCHRIRTWRQ